MKRALVVGLIVAAGISTVVIASLMNTRTTPEEEGVYSEEVVGRVTYLGKNVPSGYFGTGIKAERIRMDVWNLIDWNVAPKGVVVRGSEGAIIFYSYLVGSNDTVLSGVIGQSLYLSNSTSKIFYLDAVTPEGDFFLIFRYDSSWYTSNLAIRPSIVDFNDYIRAVSFPA